jgi:DNA-binding response OmpR family regulator
LASHTGILIVNRFAESREALRTALVHNGVRVLDTARADFGLTLARATGPAVIVLDLDTVDHPATVVADFAAVAKSTGGRLILLGSAQHQQHAESCEFFVKPYHYRPLVLRIEELLQQRRGSAAA